MPLRVVEGLAKGILAGSVELSENSGKTSLTVSHFFSISAMKLSFWLAWKRKVVGLLVHQYMGKGVEK